MIYSIGYGGLKDGINGDDLEHVLDVLKVDILLDVRAKPSSRKAGFSQKALLKRFGGRYQWAGDVLGGLGRRKVPAAGLELVRSLHAQGKTVVMMCLEHAPGECHRHHIIAVPLLPEIDVIHIYKDELVLASELERSGLDDNEYTILADSPLAGRPDRYPVHEGS